VSRFELGLIGVGDEEAARREGGRSLVDAAASLQFLRALDALLAGQSRVHERVAGQSRGVAQLADIVRSLGAAATLGAVGLCAGRIVNRLGRLFGHEAARSLWRVSRAPALATLCAEGTRRSVGYVSTSAASAADLEAAR